MRAMSRRCASGLPRRDTLCIRRIISQGNQLYLKKAFPHMSHITSESVKVLAE
ncbi:hypothetical protein T484DRAFT_1963180 [Baffinella frigidus]|nr:hypothetical protein T484DRAFT_1963180 [Cryptophyta sp. CCMP2293]